MRQFLPATILLIGGVLAQGTGADEARLAEAAQRLAAIGYDVPEQIRAESRTSKQAIADLEAQQELFLPADAFVIQHALFDRLGLSAGPDAAALRQQTLAGMVRGLSAYYDPIRKVFVLLPSITREVGEALAGHLPLFVHELVHAHQDARVGGLQAHFGGDRRSLDSAFARRCAVEGEAEIAAVVALRDETAVAQFEQPSMAGTLDRLFGGELTGMIYESGRRLVAVRHRQGGMDAIRALWQDAPLSTEQVLHAGKYGADVPIDVTVPELKGLSPAHTTTVGELMIVHLLRLLGVDRLDAGIAAAGWDGDRLVLLDRGDEATVAMVWRSVWDRDEDAADFAQRLGAVEHGKVAVAGRVVDWFTTDDTELLAAIDSALAGDRKQPPATDTDAASTAAAEAALRAELDKTRTDGAYWRHDAIGVAVPIGDGWEVREVNGVEILLDTDSAGSGFAINVNVMAQPSGGLDDVHALIDQNRDQFERMKLHVDKFEVVSREGLDVVDGEYHGSIGSMAPMHFLALAWLRGDQQIWVTVTCSEAQWVERGEALRELMAGVRITMP